MSCQIRKAALYDLPAIMAELKKFDDFYGSHFNLYKNDEQTEKVISSFITDHLFLVAESDDGIIGFISGILHPHLYNPDITVLAETFWWVAEEHRKSRAGLLLLNEYVKFGKENADWIICTIEDNSPVNPKTFYKRGFKLKEKSFLMEVS